MVGRSQKFHACDCAYYRIGPPGSLHLVPRRRLLAPTAPDMTVYYDPDRIQSGAFPALLAIGDSWFWYPFVSNLLAELSAVVRPAYSNILTLGKVGATLKSYAVGVHAPALGRQLGPNFVRYYSAFLISGGGNDAVDWGLCLKSDCTGKGHRRRLRRRAETR